MNEGGHFSISIRADEHDALVTVVDDGAGIPNDLLQRALELALSRRFTERAYTARIPLHDRAARSSMPPPTYRVSPRRRILVVDDNVDAAETLATMLAYSGHDVRVAHGGREALAAARDFIPGVMILDLGMPEMDGYAVARAVRADTLFSGMRLIALSGYGQPDDRRRTAAAGFDAHLVKPVEHDVLNAALGESSSRRWRTG